MKKTLFLIIVVLPLTLFCQDLDFRRKIKETDSCARNIKRLNLQLNELYNKRVYYSRIGDLYRDSLFMMHTNKYYKELWKNTNYSNIWYEKSKYYDSLQSIYQKDSGWRFTNKIDSLYYLATIEEFNLEVLYKEDPKDLVAYMDFYKKNNGVDLTFNHPRLKGSKIANLKIGDSMSFYFFTWYTIEGNWKYIKNRKDLTKNNRIGIVDGVINGDLPVELYRYYDSMGYTKVWFLRKMTLTRLPCYWLVTAYKDIYFNNDNFKFCSSQYDSMMKDGKERFKFEYEATLANCYTSMKGKIEYTFPIDFYKENYLMSNESFYLHDVIWRYAEYELLYKPQKHFRDFHRYKTYRRNYKHNYMSNNFMVKFSDGTYTTRYIPFWLYLRKKYVRHWKP